MEDLEDIYSEEKIREIRVKNFEDAKRDFENRENYIMVKINNIADDFGYEPDYVYDLVANSEDTELKDLFIAVRLAKDPTRQNIYEKSFELYMESNSEGFEKLSPSGKKAYYLTENGLIKGNVPQGVDKTKSLDFSQSIGEIKYYFYHKHTRNYGGGQTNQHRDMIHFIRLAKDYCLNHNDHIKFIGVIDGPYYNENIRNEIESYAEDFLGDRIFVLTWREVISTICL